MAKNHGNRPQLLQDIPPDDDDYQTEIMSSDTEDFLASLDDGEGIVKVYRRKAGSSQGMEFMFNCKPGEYTRESLEEHLQHTYGGGDYTVRVYTGKPRQLRGSDQLSIAPPAKPLTGVVESSRVGGMDETTRLILAMQQESKDQMLTMMQSSQQMMMGVMQAAFGRPVAQGPSISDIIQIMQAGGNKGGGMTAAEMLQLVMQGIELGKETAGGGGDENLLGTMVKSFGPALAAMATAAPAAAPRMPPLPARPSIPHARQAPPIPASQGVDASVSSAPHHGPVPMGSTQPQEREDVIEHDTDEATLFVELMRRVVRAARRGSDPDLWAEIIIDETPDIDGLGMIMGDDDLYGHLLYQIAAAQGPIDDVRGWFDECRAAIRDHIAGYMGESAHDGPEADENPDT